MGSIFSRLCRSMTRKGLPFRTIFPRSESLSWQGSALPREKVELGDKARFEKPEAFRVMMRRSRGEKQESKHQIPGDSQPSDSNLQLGEEVASFQQERSRGWHLGFHAFK